jgi:hypothetical protein
MPLIACSNFTLKSIGVPLLALCSLLWIICQMLGTTKSWPCTGRCWQTTRWKGGWQRWREQYHFASDISRQIMLFWCHKRRHNSECQWCLGIRAMTRRRRLKIAFETSNRRSWTWAVHHLTALTLYTVHPTGSACKCGLPQLPWTLCWTTCRWAGRHTLSQTIWVQRQTKDHSWNLGLKRLNPIASTAI